MDSIHKTYIQARHFYLRSLFLVLSGLCVGYLVGLSAAPSSNAHAEIVEEPRREAFKAAALVNEPMIRDIAGTLKRIEHCLERIEKNTGPATPTKTSTTPTKK